MARLPSNSHGSRCSTVRTWITLGVITEDEGTVFDWQEQKYTFEVMNPSQMAGMVSFPVEIKFASDELHRVEGS